jgi:hypothetical protein
MMVVRRVALPRRTFLRGLGAVVALPFLDAMVPAMAQSAAMRPRRFGFVYVPHGWVLGDEKFRDHQYQWRPLTEGPDFAFTPTLKPLEPLRQHVIVVSGLDGPKDYAAGGHATGPASWLTGRSPKRTEGEGVSSGVTLDQVIASRIGQDTPFPSMEVATEDFTGLVGSCETGYSCAYMNTISWAAAATPLPMEIRPRVVFERMFGGTGTPAERVARLRTRRSILDSVTTETLQLQRTLGARDGVRVGEYLDSVREIERRIERVEQTQSTAELPRPNVPIGIPESFEEHVGLLFDLMVLAYQTDMTRVMTFMMAREISNRSYTHIGAPDPFHNSSHHGFEPGKMEQLFKISTYHVQLFARFLDKLRTTPDGDGSLLDHSLILYGSGMSEPNAHGHEDLPLLVCGGSTLGPGRHVRVERHTPHANLLVALGQRAGVEISAMGDSTGVVSL